MNCKPPQSDESWENDGVWKLLDQASSRTAGTHFVDDTVRAARLSPAPQPWWKRMFAPIPLAGLAGASAALVFSVIGINGPSQAPGFSTAGFDTQHAAEIQDIAETETLIAAVDHLDKFSDNELVTLIGF